MKDINWLINRLKAMTFGEILWRLQQKALQLVERTMYKDRMFRVTELRLKREIACQVSDISRIGLNMKNTIFSINKEISLFNRFSYEEFKKEWNAGFQTEKYWPLTFSYDLNYQQRVDIGDVRTNWELNRHFQFAVLAKNYYVSGDLEFRAEFNELFNDWIAKNPFLHGISWTSVMEVSIRINSWIFSYCFLKQANEKYQDLQNDKLLEDLRLGILAMTDYVMKHYSRFSSANNHLIIEAYAIGLSGILFNHKKWIELSIRILTNELKRQNFTDGVNKEMSLHYQTFIMEAYGLIMHMLKHNNIEVPYEWYFMLDKMSQFVLDCIGEHGEVIEFGDNDEGKILDLFGKEINYYRYVLDLMGCELRNRYSDLRKCHENIYWLYTEKELEVFRDKKLYKNGNSICYPKGGYSLLRSKDKRVLIAIDHAPLGFGSIAAHGHADALSFQMFAEGIPIFIDPGTFNYHFRPQDRNYFRKTINHNTLTINNKDQSEMLGAFLWGKKAEVCLLKHKFNKQRDTIAASHSGYGMRTHKRQFEFDKIEDQLLIKDYVYNLNENDEWCISYCLGPNIHITKNNNNQLELQITNMKIIFTIECEVPKNKYFINVDTLYFSSSYNLKEKTKVIRISGNGQQIVFVKVLIKVEILSASESIEIKQYRGN